MESEMSTGVPLEAPDEFLKMPPALITRPYAGPVAVNAVGCVFELGKTSSIVLVAAGEIVIVLTVTGVLGNTTTKLPDATELSKTTSSELPGIELLLQLPAESQLPLPANPVQVLVTAKISLNEKNKIIVKRKNLLQKKDDNFFD
jgi:hypothetical protein